MATRLVAILLVLLVCRGLPDLVRLRNFAWWTEWLDKVGRSSTPAVFAFGLAAPVVLCALAQLAVNGALFGLIALAFAASVLYLCWGPRDLERDVEAIAKAPDSERRAAVLQGLRADGATTGVVFSAEALVETTFAAALKRWFGVLFWFTLLGPAGALLYRLAQLLAHAPAGTRDQPAAQQEAAQRLALALDWAPAHLLAVSLALASNFDAVFKTWHDYHRSHGKGYFCLDLGFLSAIARASVDADVAAAESGQDAHSPLVALEDAMVLVRRVAVVWLTLLALVVLGNWFA
jgi:AmpE protein